MQCTTGELSLLRLNLQGRLMEAVDAYERALAAAPNFEIVRNNLAIALTELGTRTKMEGGPPGNDLSVCTPAPTSTVYFPESSPFLGCQRDPYSWLSGLLGIVPANSAMGKLVT